MSAETTNTYTPDYGGYRVPGESEWPDYRGAVRTIVAARQSGHTDVAATAVADRYRGAHYAYFDRTSEALEARAAASKGGLDESDYNVGDVARFASKAGEFQSPLDLEALGLPRLEQDPKDDRQTPLAVVIHRAQEKGPVTSVELLLSDGKQISHRYLENIPAAANGQAEDAKARWVQPGQILLSQHDVHIDPMAYRREDRHGDRVMLTLRAAKPEYHDAGVAKIIRAKPSKDELTPEKAYHERRRPFRKIINKLAAIAFVGMAAATVSKVTPTASSPDQNKQLNSAGQLVLPAGTKMDSGLRQAEGLYKQPELDRTRNALDAYFRGDKEALKSQMEANNFHPNWMAQEQVAAVENAKTPAELEAAFNAVFEGLGVTLVICTEDTKTRELEQRSGRYGVEPSTDLERARRVALSAMRIFNTIDRDMFKKKYWSTLRYYVVGDITGNDDVDPAGYFIPNDQYYSVDQIVISDQQGAHLETNVGHETSHFIDYWSARAIGMAATSLNPDDHNYVGQAKYLLSPTKVGGWNVVKRDYGNVDEGEDAATVMEDFLGAHPEISWENSPLGEKTMAVIFELEKEYPGFTAALLLRATTVQPSETGKFIDTVLFEIQKYGREYSSLAFEAGIFTVLFALTGRMRARQSRSALNRYGILPGGRYSPVVYVAGRGWIKPDSNMVNVT